MEGDIPHYDLGQCAHVLAVVQVKPIQITYFIGGGAMITGGETLSHQSICERHERQDPLL